MEFSSGKEVVICTDRRPSLRVVLCKKDYKICVIQKLQTVPSLHACFIISSVSGKYIFVCIHEKVREKDLVREILEKRVMKK